MARRVAAGCGAPTWSGRGGSRARSFAGAGTAALLVAALPSIAKAQDKTFYLDRLYMAGAPDDAIGLWRPEVSDKTRIYGQAGLGFSLDPLRVENHIDDEADAAVMREESGAPVSTQLIAYLDAGAQFLGRFALSAQLPVIVGQTGNPTSRPGIDAPTNVDLMPAALMDMRLDGRAILFRTDSRSFKLAANAAAWLPTGNEYSFGGDRGASGGLGLSAELDVGRLFFVLNGFAHLRPKGVVNDLAVGSEWRWGGGAFMPLADGRLRLGVEVFGSTGIAEETFFEEDATPLEWMAEARYATDSAKRGYVGIGAGTRLSGGYAPDVRAVAVAGYSFTIEDTDARSPSARFRSDGVRAADSDDDGYPDDIDLCPMDPEDGKPPNPSDGCPALADRDEDGIPDISDRCPDQPEDFDRVQDRDGCPEDDADKDGFPDARDVCPTTPGDTPPIAGREGCPRFIEEGPGGIGLLQPVQFENGKSRILPGSFPMLDEVVRLLKVSIDIDRVRIEGHTDNRGPDELNEKLSNDRAHSVMRYLLERGIEERRLSAQGFGPRIPIADNNTAEGRRKNRRVEFKLVGR